MEHSRGSTKALNSDGEVINRATEETLQELVDNLGDLTDAAVASGDASLIALSKHARDEMDELLTRVGDNTDAPAPTGDGSIIALAKSIRDKLTELDAAFDARDLATETTLAAFKAEAKSESDETQSKLDAIDTTLGTPRQEDGHGSDAGDPTHITGTVTATPSGIQDVNVVGNDVGLATEATVATLLTEATFTAEDFATETTLEAARALLATIDVDTSNLDVALSTRASEATVATLLTEATFNAEDFATETTLEAARVLLASLEGKDFATETTLAALKTAFDSEDFASETTLAALAATDFATETTLDVVRDILVDVHDDAADSLRVKLTESIEIDIGEDETDDGTIAAGQEGLRTIPLLYGYDTSTGTWRRVNLRDLAADGHSINTPRLQVASALQFYNGTSLTRARGDAANGLDVDVTRSALPTGAATAANQQTDALTDAELRATPVKVDDDETQSKLDTLIATDFATEAKQDTQIAAEEATRDSLAIIDDWDESDRAKVNPIVGQAGVDGGAGASTAKTIRAHLSDDSTVGVRLPTLEEALKVKIALTHKWKSVKTIVGTIKTTYVAIAPVGTATSTASWTIIRFIEDLSSSEQQIEGRSPMAYDNRADPTLDSLVAWEAL